jgi:iron complex transport system substrate-binding protein
VSVTLLRRRTLLGCAIGAVVAGCAGPPPSASGRTVDSVHGPIAVPERAERVVCLDLSKIQRMLDVGCVPIGVPDGWQPVAEHAAWYASVARTGTQSAPDVEAIAALRPDLVLGSPHGVDDALYGRLSALAPTVVLAARGLGAGWKELSEADAVAAGRQDGLAAARERYLGRVAELRATHAAALRERWIGFYGIPGGAYALLPESGPGVVLTDLGVPPVAQVSGIFQEVSYEEVGRYAGAGLVLLDAQADGSLTPPTAALRAQPTFASLADRAVAASHLLVFSYGEALALLDQLDAALR